MSDWDDPPRRSCLGPVGWTIVLVCIVGRIGLLFLRTLSPVQSAITQQPTPVPIEVTPSPAPFMATPVVYAPTATPVPMPAYVPVPTQTPAGPWTAPPASTIYPTVWETTDGKTYHNVQVQSVEADRVTITYDDNAICMVPTEYLPPNLKKLLNYNPVEAGKAAAQHFLDQLNDKDSHLDQLDDKDSHLDQPTDKDHPDESQTSKQN